MSTQQRNRTSVTNKPMSVTNTAVTDKPKRVTFDLERKPMSNSMSTPMQDYFASFHSKDKIVIALKGRGGVIRDVILPKYKYSAPTDDEHARISLMENKGWERVKDKGNNVEYSGKGIKTHILLRTPMEYFLQDEAERQNIVDQTEGMAPDLGGLGYLPKDDRTGQDRMAMIEDDVSPM